MIAVIDYGVGNLFSLSSSLAYLGLENKVTRSARELDEAAQQKILNLCLEHGGEYYQALFEFVTTDASATALAMRHHMDKTTLYRKVRKYYENFPTQL